MKLASCCLHPTTCCSQNAEESSSAQSYASDTMKQVSLRTREGCSYPWSLPNTEGLWKSCMLTEGLQTSEYEFYNIRKMFAVSEAKLPATPLNWLIQCIRNLYDQWWNMVRITSTLPISLQFRSLHFSSAEDGISTLGKAHMRSTLLAEISPVLSFETDPVG